MPIKGLTTNHEASFPEIGKIRKGDKKPNEKQPGKDLHYFRFVTEDRAAELSFTQAFGNEPDELTVYMPFATTNENFIAWKEDWKASSLVHRCDGETCVIWQTSNGKYSQDPKPCPGNCKQVGRLKVILPALQRMAYVTVLTTSIWDIINLHQNLSALEFLRGDLRGIPLILRRRWREISTPSGRDGQRARRKKSLLTIEADPSWVALQLEAQKQAALPSVAAPLQLEAAPFDADDDDDDLDTQSIDNGATEYLNESPYGEGEDDDHGDAPVMSPYDIALAAVLDICEAHREEDGFIREVNRQVSAFTIATGQKAGNVRELSEPQLGELKTGLELYLSRKTAKAATV